MGEDSNTQHIWATVEALTAVDSKVQHVADDVKEMRGWLEGTVSNTGERAPGVIDTVSSLKRDSNAAKWLLRMILGAVLAATFSEWIFYLWPHVLK